MHPILLQIMHNNIRDEEQDGTYYLAKDKVHVSAVEIYVFEHEHATIPSRVTDNSVST
jgi:hypothetical protein